MGMCSKCYREHEKEVAKQKSLDDNKRTEELEAKKEKEQRNKNHSQCFYCRKKPGLVSRCDNTFFGIRRYVEKHSNALLN